MNHAQKNDKLNEIFSFIEVKLYSKLKKDLKFVGCTAIEDKLQEVNMNFNYKGVEEAIRLLKEADVKIMMLTGDKIVCK